MSGTVDLGPFPAGESGCFRITLSTGADVALVYSSSQRTPASNARHPAASTANPNPNPILTVTIGQGFQWNSPFDQLIVNGMQLNVSPSLNFPDGTYVGVIAAASGSVLSGIPKQVTFTAKNGVLTVSGLNMALVANTADVLMLYGRGVLPPAQLPSPTPSPTPSPAPGTSPTPTPAPTATPTPQPTTTPTPASTPTPAPTPTPTPPVGVLFQEGSFVPACENAHNNCHIAQVNSVVLTRDDAAHFSLTIDLFYDNAATTDVVLSSTWNIPYLRQDKQRNNAPFTVQSSFLGEPMTESLVSDWLAVNSNACVNPNGYICGVPVYFDTQANELIFNGQITALQQQNGF